MTLRRVDIVQTINDYILGMVADLCTMYPHPHLFIDITKYNHIVSMNKNRI